MFRTKVVEEIKTRFCVQTLFISKFVPFEIIWKSTCILELDRPLVTVWRTLVACWILRATNTHSGCVILNAFPVLQWLHESTSVFRDTYIACLVFPLGFQLVFQLHAVQISLLVLLLWHKILWWKATWKTFEKTIRRCRNRSIKAQLLTDDNGDDLSFLSRN